MTDAIVDTQTTESTPTHSTEATPVASFSFDDFMGQYQPEQRQLYEKQGIKDFDSLHKSVSGLLSKLGQKGLIPPKETATEQEKSDFQKQLYKHIGVPEDGIYEYTLSEDVDSEIISDDFVNQLADIASKNGVSKTAFESIVNEIYKQFQPEYQELVSEIEQLKARLGQEGKMDIASQSAPPQDLTADIDTKRREFLKAQNEGRTQDAITLKDEYNALVQKQISLQK